MILFDRQWLCSKLALSRWQSYKVFPATKTGRIREADALEMLNRIRVALPEMTFVPQLATAEEIEAETSVPARKLVLWARRKRNPIPNFHFNNHVVRFPKQMAAEWLEEQSK